MLNPFLESKAELVLTVPNSLDNQIVAAAHARTTLGVLVELISKTEKRIIVGAPFIQSTQKISDGPLGIAFEAALTRGVRLDIISTGSTFVDFDFSNLKRFKGQLLRRFQPKINLDNSKALGSHAKFCLSDDRSVYIGSANLTEKGIAEHLEMGMLAHGKLAKQISTFIHKLFDVGYFVEIK